jgi:miniconductance mechanosensitive channel
MSDIPLPEFFDVPFARSGLSLIVLLVGVFLLHQVTRHISIALAQSIVRRTRAELLEDVLEARVPHRAALLVPLLAFRIGMEAVPELPAGVELFIDRLTEAIMILVVSITIGALATALHRFYLQLPIATNRTIKSYVQLAKLTIYSIAGIFIIARLAGQSPWFLVSGLGAMMAIILLIFRDTLLSLVASVQLTNNDLVRVGDWIEMPQFDADGDVVDIALNTVKVENWDKTITVIPTHKFLEHSFKNWRNMFERGGRRIKRSIYINTATMRFLTEEEIERFSRFELLRDYMRDKKAELEAYNESKGSDPDVIINARRLTNIGTLRAYISAYLRSHPRIRQDMTFLVRQIDPTPEGVPIQIYVFTNDTRWAHYEGIQSDIFDHILAMVPEFGLAVYQRPSSLDLARAVGDLA